MKSVVSNRRSVARAILAAGILGLFALGSVGLFVAQTATAATGINHTVSFQGKVTNTDGTNVTNGSYSFVFKIYTVATAGTAVWTETKSLTVTDGIFQTQLGDTTSLPGSVDFNTDNIYLGMSFNSDPEMSPRIQFTAVPQAFNSEKLGGIAAAGFVQLSPGSQQTGAINVSGNINSNATVSATTSLQAPLLDTASAVQLNVGTATASSVVVGRATSTTATTIQGSGASTWAATGASGTTTIGFTAPTANTTLNFPAATAGTYTICTTYAASCSATYQAAGNYLAKNAADTSTISATGNLYGLSNTGTGAGGVLGLTNSGTNSALSVSQSGNPTSGQALIVANTTNGTPSGNLIDLQKAGTSQFAVDTSGNVTQIGGASTTDTINGQRISSAANFTGTITAGTGITVTAGGLTVTAGGATITAGGLNVNSTGITNAGAISGATTVTANGTITGGGTFKSADTAVASTPSGAVSLNSGNASGTGVTSNSGAVSVDSGTSTNGTTGAVNVGTANASVLNLGRAGASTAIQGNSSSTIQVNNATNYSLIQFTAPTAQVTYTLGTNASNTTATICTTIAASCSSVYQAAGAYIAKNPTASESSSSSIVGNQYSFANTNTGAAGVLTLANSGTNSALSVSQSANPTANQALILATNSNGTPSGNLLDLRVTTGSQFAVDYAGNVTQNGGTSTADTINGQRISSAANFTGTVTAATSVIAPLHATANAAGAVTADLAVKSGNVTSGAFKSGDVTVDSGTSTGTTGAISIGGTSASAINIGHSGVATTVTGNFVQGTGTFSLAGNGASSLTTSAGGITLTANATSVWSTTTGDLTLQSTAASTSVKLLTGNSGTIEIGSSGTATVNVGAASNNIRAINIGTAGTSQPQTIIIGSVGGASATTLIAGTGNLNLNAATIATNQTTVSLLNATATSVAAFGAATTIGFGAANSITTLGGATGTATLQTSAGTLTLGGAAGITVNSAAQSGAATGAVTIASGNVTSGAFASGAINVDTGTSTGTTGAITVGANNASAVNIGRTGTINTLNGTTQIGATTGTGALVNNGSTVNTGYPMANLATGGWDAGGAATTVDKYTYISANQTTAGQTLTIPSPTAGTSYGRLLFLSNIGNQSFQLLGTTIGAGSTATLVWSNATGGAKWTFAGADGSGILNQNGSDQSADFRISGTGRANTSFISPLFDSITGALNLGTGTATGITIGGATTTGTIAIGNSAANTISIGTSANAHTIGIGTDASTVQGVTVGSNSGASATTLVAGTGNLNLNAANINTNQTTSALLNTTATTVNAFGAATAVNLGASGSTFTLGNTGGTATLKTGAGSLTLQGAAGLTANTPAVAGAVTGGITIATGNVTSGAFASGSISLDTGSSTGTTGGVTIGGTNASTIAIGKTTANATTTVNGLSRFRTTTGNDSIAAFQVQKAAGAAVLDVDTTNGYVGINNAAPGYAVDAIGTFNSQGSGAGYRFGAQDNSGNNSLIYSATGEITFYTGFQIRATLLPTGYFGIGQNLVPQFPLDVAGVINTSTTVQAATSVLAPLMATADVATGTSAALTIRSGNATAGNANSGTVTVDSGAKNGSGTAGVLNVGTTNASALTIGRTGVTTAIGGTLQVGTLNTPGTGALINNGTTKNSTLAIGDTASGAIGTAAATVDIYTGFTVNQTTTTGATLTIPTPTVGAAASVGRIIYVSNIGTIGFTLLTGGTTMNPGATATLIFNGTNWTFAGADASGIQNQSASDQSADFRITGTGRANTKFITPLIDSITGGLSVGTSTATSVTVGGAATTAVTIGNAANSSINIGTGAFTHTINIGTDNTTVQGITIGSTTTGSTTAIQGPTVTVGTAGASIFKNNGATANAVCAYTVAATGTTQLNTATKTPDVCTAFAITNTFSGVTVSVPTPTAGAGSVVYISNQSGSTNPFTLLGSQISVGSTATLVYNGTTWTFAGADASGLQTAYNNSTGASQAEIVLDTTRNGLDIQDQNTTSIGNTTPLLAVRSSASAGSLGNPLFTVTNNAGVPLVGIGTNVATRTLEVASSAATSTAPQLLVSNSSTNTAADATLELKTNSKSFYAGVDSSDNGKFKISSSTASGTITTFGKTTPGGLTDGGDNNSQECSKFTSGAAGTINSLTGYYGSAPSGGSLMQMALYGDNGIGTSPAAFLGSSSSVPVNANSWMSVPVSIPVTASTVYWICANTNSANSGWTYDTVANGGFFKTSTFGTWTSPYGGGGSASNTQFAFYATYVQITGFDTFGKALLTMSDTGQTTLQNSTDSTTALQVQNAAGTTNLLTADTTNSRVSVVSAVGETAAYDLSLGGGAARTIGVNAPTTTGAGAALTVVAAAGNAGIGGQLNLLGGAGVGTNQAGGAVALTGGTSTGNAAGGAVTLSGGAAGGAGTGGALIVQGGAASATAGSSSGALTVRSAAGAAGAGATAGGAAGVLSITGGNGGAGTGTNSTGAAGAAVNVTAGTGGAATGTGSNGVGGAINLTGGTGGIGGTGSVSTGGAVTMQGGAAGAVAGGVVGAVQIFGGTASATGTGGAGGNIVITASNAAGSGNNAGGNITLTAGTATNSGIPGVVNIDTPVFTAITATGSYVQSANNQTFNMAVADINTASTVVVTLTGAYTGGTVTVPAPTNTTTGRVVYITNGSATIPFTLSPLGSSPITMNVNSTATLVWNNATSTWTAAGADASTSLQQVYNNTATSPVSIVTSSTAKYLNFQAGTGADTTNVFQVSNSAGAQVLSVDTTNTATGANVAVNGGGETVGTPPTGWVAHGAATITSDSTAGEFTSGVAGVKVATTAATTVGVRNNVGTAMAASTPYVVSFSAKVGTAMTNANMNVVFSPAGTTSNNATCSTLTQTTNPTLNTTSFIKYTCTLTTTSTATTSAAYLAIYQGDAVARNIFIDNLAIVAQNSTGAQNVGVLRVGGAASQGLTLLTVDSFAGPPVATGATINASLLGSLYYDTTIGKLQCYEAKGWGSCGNSPNNSAFLIPEYPNAVLYGVPGSNIGTMTAGLCSGSGRLNVDTTLCSNSSDDYSYYKWTSPQTASSQTYSIYVRYQLPATYNGFLSSSTVKLTGRTSSTTDGSVAYSLYSANGSTACGASASLGSTPVTTANNTWQTVNLAADETSNSADCTFAANDIITFKIDVAAKNNANVYVSNLTFTTKGL